MSYRKALLVNNKIYHVLNRGVASQPIFFNKKNYQRALNTIFYYQNKNVPLRYSYFIIQSKEKREEIIQKLKQEKNFLVEIIAYCLMPNHFHLLLKQLVNNGISKFIANFTNSYVRYFNTKNSRSGPLFEGKFKAIRIETDEQLLHVNRYIHLNPYTSYLVKNIEDLEKYPYSSFPEYLKKIKTNFCQKNNIFYHFKNLSEYKNFVFAQADYQRTLNNIKHLILETYT